jgi:hypothetical protein
MSAFFRVINVHELILGTFTDWQIERDKALISEYINYKVVTLK